MIRAKFLDRLPERIAVVLILTLPLVAHAAVLDIDPSKGCVGTVVQITGEGWLEPAPVCHYRFLFDHPNPGDFTEDIASRQPDGLFGPPNSSFTVPDDSVPGPHKVRVDLYLNSGEFLERAERPFTVIGVEYDGATNCSALDSGFDKTNVGTNTGSLGADGPAIVSVASGQTTKVAKALITPKGDAKEVGFKSSDSSIATVSPAKATGSPQILNVKGVAALIGVTSVEAFTGEDVMCKELKVAVYRKETVKVTANIVQLKKPDGKLCPAPKEKVNAKKFADGLNKIWDQAAVGFNVKVRQFLKKKAIAADEDGNCRVDEAGVDDANGQRCTSFTGATEMQKVIQGAKDPVAHVNIYFVQNYSCPYALYVRDEKAIFGLGFADQSPPTFTSPLLMAHELGHHLDLPHCDSGSSLDNNCAGEGVATLMHSQNTGCLIHKPEWDTSNIDATTGG